MKVIVAYDSVHGNTKQVAEAIAEQIKADGHEVQLISIKDGGTAPNSGDFMFIGSPTRSTKATKGAREFIDALDGNYWGSRPVVLFDTVGPLSKDQEKRESDDEYVRVAVRDALCRDDPGEAKHDAEELQDRPVVVHDLLAQHLVLLELARLIVRVAHGCSAFPDRAERKLNFRPVRPLDIRLKMPRRPQPRRLGPAGRQVRR